MDNVGPHRPGGHDAGTGNNDRLHLLFALCQNDKLAMIIHVYNM